MTIISELFDDARFMIGYRREKMKSQKLLDKRAPKDGDMAPDFTLADISGTESVTLSDFRGKKPVVLVFGSYT
jgi:peroxiredoxin